MLYLHHFIGFVSSGKDVDLVQLPNIFNDTPKVAFTYGTVFCGAPTHEDLWGTNRCLFHIDDSIRGDSSQYYNNIHRLNIKKLPSVDVLFVQCTEHQQAFDSFMSRWLDRSDFTPTIVMIYQENAFLSYKGEFFKRTQRQLRHRDYVIDTDLLESVRCGASTREKFLVSICSRSSQPTPYLDFHQYYLPLAERSCQNLIRNYNIPHKKYRSWTPQVPLSCPEEPNLLGHVQDKPVYSISGPIGGSREQQYIYIEGKGIRPLEHDEWCKVKGFTSTTIHSSICGLANSLSTHVWTTLGHALIPYLPHTCSLDNLSSPMSPTGPSPSDSSSPSTVPPSTWTWTPPDLSASSSFRQDSIKRLTDALAFFPIEERTRLYDEGLVLLNKHSQNFTPEGPKKLVLLWWEWPSIHWYELCYGMSMNFMEVPKPGFKPNQDMSPEKLEIACKFMDQLIELEVLIPCDEHEISNNFPLFVVPKPKPEQHGEFRCIADGKKGTQNEYCVPDPVQMTSPDHILPRLYNGGYSAMLDLSKYFHMFKTLESEHRFMGVIHPKTGQFFKYARCPMGSRNSPGATGRCGFSLTRCIFENSDLFEGLDHTDNSFVNIFSDDQLYHPEYGEGRIYRSKDGTLTVLVWLHVDDILVHGPTQEKVEEALTFIVNHAMRLGLIIQPAKAELPSQRIQYCGFIYDTTSIPKLEVPRYKLSRALAMVRYLLSGSYTSLARLTLAIVVGNLQSIVPATSGSIGACFLRALYNDLHSLKETPLLGTKAYYFTSVLLSSASRDCLRWWVNALTVGVSKSAYPVDCATVSVTWGDGSGTGTGGTATLLSQSGFHDSTADKSLPKMDMWLGVWKSCVHSFSSNWRECRTLEITLELELKRPVNRVRNRRLFYFTDNSVTYDMMHKSSSPSPELMRLITNIRMLELKLGCQLEVVHVPGVTMIYQGTDGLSRGVLPSSFSSHHEYNPMSSLFQPASPSNILISTVLLLLQLPPDPSPWIVIDSTTSWYSVDMIGKCVFWCLPPQLCLQAMLFVTYRFCESPFNTHHIFVVPRILLRQFIRVNKYFSFIGPFWDLPIGFSPCRVPFMIFSLPPYCRLTTYLREKENQAKYAPLDISTQQSVPFWIHKQVERMHGLPPSHS